jgi:hypothetical protein
MGINYYHFPHECPCCRHKDRAHIGKSSWGWTFSFQGTETIRSWRDWQLILSAGGEIRDEYGCTVPLDDLRALIESKRTAQHNHTTYCRSSNDPWTRLYGNEECWLDEEGNSFSGRDFS